MTVPTRRHDGAGHGPRRSPPAHRTDPSTSNPHHRTLEAVHTLTVAVYAINEQQSEILRRLEGRG
ncbi:MAG: hypothetical protein DYG90_06955 [Chloroflexi bacterium CFX6]|nr:hypothetical protein [Chloroflexi bacterium CFX6]